MAFGTLEIRGYAVVSSDGRIADREGRFPADLRFDADQALFQQALDQADLTVLGRRTHEAAPNLHNRTRLVLSRGVEGLVEEDAHTLWLNPEGTDLATVLGSLATDTGTIVVAGGTAVYDLFAATLGYDAFFVSVAERVRLSEGAPIFAGCRRLADVERRLEGAGLVLHKRTWLDRTARLRLIEYVRAG